MDVAGHAFEGHIAHDLLDEDEASLRFELQRGFFGDHQLEIGFRFRGLRAGIEKGGGDVDAVAGLFGFDTDFLGGLGAGEDDFGVAPGFHFNAAIANVLDDHHGPTLDGKVLFKVLRTGGERRSYRPEEYSSAQNWKHVTPNQSQTHVSLRSCRDPTSRKVVRLFVDRPRPGIPWLIGPADWL